MSDGSALIALLANTLMIVVLYCEPMLKRMDELEKSIDKIKEQLDHIEKALYVMPDDGGDAE